MEYIVNSLPKHQTQRYRKRKLSQIKNIVVHHFAGNISVYEAAEYHVSKGWPGIGYTIVIDGPKSYMTNDLDTICYGVAKNNTACLSVSVRGNYENELPASFTLNELENVIHILRGILGPLPVKVHSDFVNTKCPGAKLREWVVKKYP